MEILIHPISSHDSKKNWSEYQYLAHCLLKVKNNITIVGNENEKTNLFPDKCYDLRGKTSIKELIDLIKKSDLFIGNDSGISHLASFHKLKCIIIVTKFISIRVLRNNQIYLYNPTVSQVIEKLQELEKINYVNLLLQKKNYRRSDPVDCSDLQMYP